MTVISSFISEMNCYFNNELGKASCSGFCKESGAYKTVRGREQWSAYVQTLQDTPPVPNVERSFRFAKTMYFWKEACPVMTMQPKNASTAFKVSVIDQKDPILQGLDIFRRYGIFLDFATGHMRGRAAYGNFSSTRPLTTRL